MNEELTFIYIYIYIYIYIITTPEINKLRRKTFAVMIGNFFFHGSIEVRFCCIIRQI